MQPVSTDSLPSRDVGRQQALEELAMVGYEEVEQLVNDDDFLKRGIIVEQVAAEAEPAGERT